MYWKPCVSLIRVEDSGDFPSVALPSAHVPGTSIISKHMVAELNVLWDFDRQLSNLWTGLNEVPLSLIIKSF